MHQNSTKTVQKIYKKSSKTVLTKYKKSTKMDSVKEVREVHIEENEFYYIDDVCRKFGKDYNFNCTKDDEMEGYITAEDLFEMVQDLLCEIGRLEEKIEDMQKGDNND